MEVGDLYQESSRVLLIGTYPPPLGGVSVHIYRLKKLLEAKGINVQVFDLSIKKFPGVKTLHLLLILLIRKYDVVHVHSSAKITTQLIYFIKQIRPIKIYFTDHNSRMFNEKNSREIKLIRRFIKNLEILFVVSDEILLNYKTKNIMLPEKVFVKDAFLPPPMEDESKIKHTYPEALDTFINNQQPLLMANAYQLNFFQNEDLYGLDHCILLVDKLKADFPNVGLIFALANDKYNQEYLNEKLTEIRIKKLEKNIFLLSGQLEIWPLYRKIDLFLRPTNTDGDAISVRESLFFQKPAIVSDASYRPEGCVLFKTRDFQSLYTKTVLTLKEINI